MALHELATNAAKYGALSTTDGHISISWHTANSGRGNQFYMTWSEHGGPKPEPPTHNGFGFTILVSAAEFSLSAHVELRYPSSGLVWELSAPLEEILESLAWGSSREPHDRSERADREFLPTVASALLAEVVLSGREVC